MKYKGFSRDDLLDAQYVLNRMIDKITYAIDNYALEVNEFKQMTIELNAMRTYSACLNELEENIDEELKEKNSVDLGEIPF